MSNVIYDRYDLITGRRYRKVNGNREYEPVKVVNGEIITLCNRTQARSNTNEK